MSTNPGLLERLRSGYPLGDLPQRCEAASTKLREAIERLKDMPLIGMEVRELRLAAERDELRDAAADKK